MDDEDLQKMIDELFAGTRKICDLTDGEFVQVLDGLSRVFCARVLNCIDPHGKKDPEWRMLSEAFSRANDLCSLCRGTSNQSTGNPAGKNKE